MDILSPPAFTEETITTHDFVYVGGFPDSVTVREGETVVTDPKTRTLTFRLKGETAEVIIVNWDNVIAYRQQKRVVRKPVKAVDE